MMSYIINTYYFIKHQCISSIWKDHFLSYLSWNHLRCQNILIESYEPDVSSAVFVYKQFSDAWNIIYKEAKRSDHQPRQTILLWLIRFCYNVCWFDIIYLEDFVFFLWRVLSHPMKHTFFWKNVSGANVKLIYTKPYYSLNEHIAINNSSKYLYTLLNKNLLQCIQQFFFCYGYHIQHVIKMFIRSFDSKRTTIQR